MCPHAARLALLCLSCLHTRVTPWRKLLAVARTTRAHAHRDGAGERKGETRTEGMGQSQISRRVKPKARRGLKHLSLQCQAYERDGAVSTYSAQLEKQLGGRETSRRAEERVDECASADGAGCLSRAIVVPLRGRRSTAPVVGGGGGERGAWLRGRNMFQGVQQSGARG